MKESGKWGFMTKSVGHESDHLLDEPDEFGLRVLDPEKTMCKLAQSELKEKCGEEFYDDVWYPGLAPMWMSFDVNELSKTFYFRSQLIKPFPTSNSMLASVWGGKEEEGRSVEKGEVEYGWLTKAEVVEYVKEHSEELSVLFSKTL